MSDWYKYGNSIINFSRVFSIENEGNKIIIRHSETLKFVVSFTSEKDCQEDFDHLWRFLESRK